MTGTLTLVPFHGDMIEATQNERGVWVGVRRCCESLGLAQESQLRKLKSKPWAIMTEMIMMDAAGREFSMVCVDLDTLPGWLFSIDSRKVKAEVRNKLVHYQKEAARVLADHFLGKKQAPEAVHVAAPVQNAGFDQLTAVVLQLVQAQQRQGEMQQQQGAAITRLAESVATLAAQRQTPPAIQAAAIMTGTFGLRDRIRSMWPDANESWRRKCMSAIRTTCNRAGIVTFPTTDSPSAPLVVDQVNMPLVDEQITRIRSRWLSIHEAEARQRTLFDLRQQQQLK